ncbi:MAG: NAD-dependent dihydropyrimidine dehydrogenase subunit PreA [Candidatus Wallbacteria bacterium]|nr:NAD-dependent dihydropyrimidine dehydrogenase subunit PreA [Candidatus Wallbacteria bacterium]
MSANLSVTFTGIRFENPFMLASAPPTESESNILRAFEAGWGGVVTKTIGLHPVVNVRGPKTKFFRTDVEKPRISMQKRPNAVLHSSWNWELISDKPIDWWLPRLARIKKEFPNKVLIASIMAGSGSDREYQHWQTLARGCQEQGVDGLELNFSCPHMDREDMGSNVGKNERLCNEVARCVTEVAKIPVWVKLTPATTNIVYEARGAFDGGARAIVSSNTWPSLPVVDPETLEFEMNVEGQVSSGGLGGPAILPMSLAKMAQMTQAFPDKEFSGIGGISDFSHALNYFLLGCGTTQVCTAAMLDQAIGPNVIKTLIRGMTEFLEKNAHRGWKSLEDFRGLKRGAIVPHSQIKRPDTADYHGGYDAEGYAEQPAEPSPARRSKEA